MGQYLYNRYMSRPAAAPPVSLEDTVEGGRASKPPTDDKGAPLTAPLENRILIDFLSWTLKVTDPHEAIRISGLSGFDFHSGCGGKGYKQSLRSGNIVVFFDGNSDMGCHVSMSGQGCREYEAQSSLDNPWYGFLHGLCVDGKEYGLNFTRLDLAIDTVDGSLPLDLVKLHAECNNVRSRYKKYGEHREKSLSTENGYDSRTIQFGSITSRCLIRFYNKAAERESALHLQPGILGSWVRCEIVLRDERANSAVRSLLETSDIGFVSVGIINNYLSFVDRSADSNISRCPLLSWWFNWLSHTDKLRLSVDKKVRLVLHLMEHLERQYSATFATIKKHLGVARFSSFVSELVENGISKMSKRHDEILVLSGSKLCEIPF